jgi:ABC-2 type transport system ATP-binding protein
MPAGTRVGSASVPAVALCDVSVSYGSRVALSNVTVTFPRGATGLLGANGAGKSSLLLAILGLVNVKARRIEVLGLDVMEVPLEVRGRIGYVPERDAWLPGLTAISAVACCGELAGLPPGDALQRAHDVLSFVGLGATRYRRVETLSTGMKRRLKLAEALVHDPDLLLLDEPTNGLDPQGREQLLALIRDLSHRHHLNVVFSSHVLEDVERACDSFVVLDHGRVAAAGRLDEWRRGGGQIYEVRIKGDESAFVNALTAAGIECHVAEGEMTRIVINDGNLRQVFVVATRLGVQVRHLRPQAPSLEDLFAERVTNERR